MQNIFARALRGVDYNPIPMKQVRARALIEGRVQGVFFRQSTAEKACELGVTGWVKNLRDGRVEALFEGNETQVHDLLEFVKIGPPHAKVQSVKITWEAYTGEYAAFQVLRDT